MAKLLVCRCFLNMKKKTVYTDLSLFPLPFRLFMFYCFLFVYIIFSKKEKKNFKKENKKEKNKSLQLKQYPIKVTFFESKLRILFLVKLQAYSLHLYWRKNSFASIFQTLSQILRNIILRNSFDWLFLRIIVKKYSNIIMTVIEK